MFITVAVSEEKEYLFNPDCMINVLLSAIKKRSNIPKRGTQLTYNSTYKAAPWLYIENAVPLLPVKYMSQ